MQTFETITGAYFPSPSQMNTNQLKRLIFGSHLFPGAQPVTTQQNLQQKEKVTVTPVDILIPEANRFFEHLVKGIIYQLELCCRLGLSSRHRPEFDFAIGASKSIRTDPH